VLQCDCGFEVRAEREGQFLAEVQRHAWEAHGMTLSLGEAVQLASRAVSDPHRRVGNRQKEEK
jgi:Protein of unknown function (DUF1059)